MSNQDYKKWNPLVLTEDNDLLKVLPKVKFLKWFIEDNFKKNWLFDSENDRMIALYGWWWTGKSSVMKTLHLSREKYTKEDKEKWNIPKWWKVTWFKWWKETRFKDNIKTIFFEAWKYEKDQNLVLSLFQYLWYYLPPNIRNENEEFWWQLLNTIVWWSSIEVDFCFFKYNYNARDAKEVEEFYLNEMLQNRESYFRDFSELTEWFSLLEELINPNGNIVIFIDDLDRCESENVINLLSAIKLFFTYMPNTIFVVWVDKRAVTLSLNRKYNDDEDKAEEYLEKIFMMSFNMPVWLTTEKLVTKYFEEDTEKWNLVMEMFDAIWFNNPRHVKKYLNKISLLYKYILKLNLNNSEYILFLYLWYLFEFKQNMFFELEDVDSKMRNWNTYITNSYQNSKWATDTIKIPIPSNNREIYKFLLPKFRKSFQNNNTNWSNYWLDKYINNFVSEETKEQLSFVKWMESKWYLDINWSEDMNQIKKERIEEILNYIKESF